MVDNFKGNGKSPYIGVGEVKKLEGCYDPVDLNRKNGFVSRASGTMNEYREPLRNNQLIAKKSE